ncbi:MAG: ABC transporter [Ruminococcaceae bacterium]|nr:ABC transporter [Oscillospiraceae bacterium]
MLALLKKEIHSYFTTPIGYAFIAIYLAVNGVLFTVFTLKSGYSTPETYFTWSVLALILLVPILTMKSFSEERKMKTDQLLLTAPISLGAVVGAKLLGAYVVYVITVLASTLNCIALGIYGKINLGVLFGSYLSLLLIGLACIAIGVFVSALTENQLVAAVFTMGLLLIIIYISLFNSQIENDFLRSVLSWISLLDRYALFTYGMFDLSALIYYISIAGVFYFLTIRVFEKRRWE